MPASVRVHVFCDSCKLQRDVDAPLEGPSHELKIDLASALPTDWKMKSVTQPDSRSTPKPELVFWCPICAMKNGI